MQDVTSLEKSRKYLAGNWRKTFQPILFLPRFEIELRRDERVFLWQMERGVTVFHGLLELCDRICLDSGDLHFSSVHWLVSIAFLENNISLVKTFWKYLRFFSENLFIPAQRISAPPRDSRNSEESACSAIQWCDLNFFHKFKNFTRKLVNFTN